MESHLLELRSRLLVSVVALLGTVGIGFWFAPDIIARLEDLAPPGTQFFQLKPGEALFVFVRVAMYSGLAMVSPVWIWQVVAFVGPGLYENERRGVYLLAVLAPVLFLVGAGFAYFLAAEPILDFLLGFGLDEAVVQANYGLEHFVALTLSLLAIFGVSFQLPILLLGLALLGLVSSRQLLFYWKYALLICFTLAALLTPTPDPFNMTILGLALSTLYGLSVAAIMLAGL